MEAKKARKEGEKKEEKNLHARKLPTHIGCPREENQACARPMWGLFKLENL